jgi:hypothetical protein
VINIKTQKLNKEIVSMEGVEQLVSIRMENEYDQFISVSSNSTYDGEESLLYAKNNQEDSDSDIAIEIGDLEDEDDSYTTSISAKDAIKLGEALISMGKFILDESNYSIPKA